MAVGAAPSSRPREIVRTDSLGFPACNKALTGEVVQWRGKERV